MVITQSWLLGYPTDATSRRDAIDPDSAQMCLPVSDEFLFLSVQYPKMHLSQSVPQNLMRL
jgi:hypothetical protein